MAHHYNLLIRPCCILHTLSEGGEELSGHQASEIEAHCPCLDLKPDPVQLTLAAASPKLDEPPVGAGESFRAIFILHSNAK